MPATSRARLLLRRTLDRDDYWSTVRQSAAGAVPNYACNEERPDTYRAPLPVRSVGGVYFNAVAVFDRDWDSTLE